MTAKGHISKTLDFLYGQVDVNLKSDGRAIDRHADELLRCLWKISWLDVAEKEQNVSLFVT